MHAVAARPMAFLSDVHGNLPALEAVLAELVVRGITDVLVAGDLVLGGEQPLDVWKRLREVDARCTRGLSDTALCTVDPTRLEPQSESERQALQRFSRTRSMLGDLALERIRRLPEKIRIPLIDGREIVMVHGSPSDPGQEISHDLTDDEILDLLGDDPADIVVCGASHVPFRREVEGAMIVNVGSVGEAPEGRVAHYTVVTPAMTGALIEQSWVEY